MHLSYKYRLMPTRAQHSALANILEDQRVLYNAALEERVGFHRRTGKARTYVDQCKALTEWRRSDSEAAATPLNLQRWSLKRLDDAYAAFFRRLKAKNGKAGLPRFRGKSWWSSFGFNEFSGIRFDGKRLRFAGMPGALRLHMHRPLPTEAAIRSCVFSKDAKGWTVCLHISMEASERCEVRTAVGIDLGLNVFAYQSDGIAIPNPRVARRAERKMRVKQRALARCRKGSKRRLKVKAEVARLHSTIKNARTTWLHQQSALLTRSYDLIAAEKLNVAGMIRNPTLARSISDASWSTFLGMVSYKAEKAGGTFVAVNPRNTSQNCSGCGELVPKRLTMRTHSCPSCGLVIDRDHNAALNILRAVAGPGQLNVAHQSVRAAGKLKEATN